MRIVIEIRGGSLEEVHRYDDQPDAYAILDWDVLESGEAPTIPSDDPGAEWQGCWMAMAKWTPETEAAYREQIASALEDC